MLYSEKCIKNVQNSLISFLSKENKPGGKHPKKIIPVCSGAPEKFYDLQLLTREEYAPKWLLVAISCSDPTNQDIKDSELRPRRSRPNRVAVIISQHPDHPRFPELGAAGVCL